MPVNVQPPELPPCASELIECRLQLRRLSACLATSLTYIDKPELAEPGLLEQFRDRLTESIEYLESVDSLFTYQQCQLLPSENSRTS